MRELSLFTGAGGGLLGSMLLGFRTVAAVEIDPYCQRVLCARGGYMADAECDGCGGHGAEPITGGLAGAVEEARGKGSPQAVPVGDCGTDRHPSREGFPVYSDVRDFHPVPGSCDIVTGGFPCQPFSQAGKRLGEDDPRNMWPHAVRVLVESGAPLGFFENVPGLLSSGYFGTVLGDLAEAGFDAEWCVLGADDVGAPHRRKRLWILAYRNGSGAGVRPGPVGEAPGGPGRDAAFDLLAGRGEVSGGGAELSDAVSGRRTQRDAGLGAVPEPYPCSPWHIDPADVGHADAAGPQGHGRPVERAGECAAAEAGAEQGLDPWLTEPYVGRVAHGVASRVDRLRALGNGQVPHTMAAAWCLLATAAGILEE